MAPSALTITDARLDGEPTALRAEGGVIVALGPDVGAQPGDEVIDGAGMALMGGLVNGHGHAAMTLFRGVGGDLQLQEWLEHIIWPAEARLTDEDVYWGTRLAAVEMIRSGTTHFFDMYWHPPAVARAATDAGIRATVGAPLFDGRDASGFAALRDTALESLEQLAAFGPLITPSLTPHALYTVSEPSLDFVAALAAERALAVQLHLSETRREVDEWMADHDERPAVYADRRGLLGPRTILAHGCHLDAAELDLIAERGATVVSNPVSNLKLVSGGTFPYPAARAAGVAVGLGTDGASSNNSLDLLADLKVFALIQKHQAYDVTAAPAGDVLAIAQGLRSPVLGGRPIAVGAPADLLLVDTDHPVLNPGPLVDNLVYAATGEVVDTTIVAGRVVMRHRVVDDVSEVVRQARRCARRLLG
jgi:5-methylthioadenosine/S-adenosylhomocysteine deaminase